MNDDALDHILGAWLREGPEQGRVEALDRALAATRRTAQRPAWRFHVRDIHVTTMLRGSIVVAAVVIVAFIAFELLPGQSGVTGGPSPIPTSIVTAPPSAAPSPSGSSAATDCNDGQGCLLPLPAGPVTSRVFTPKLTFTAPAGYYAFEDTAQTFGVLTSHAGSDNAKFYVFRDPAPSTNDNDCEGDPNQAIGALTVDSISSAFATDKRFQVSTPEPVTIGPYSGKTFDLQLASTWTGTCPWSDGKPGAMVLTVQNGPTPTSPSYGLGPGDPPLVVYLLDIGGRPIWIQEPAAFRAEEVHVLQTLSFAP